MEFIKELVEFDWDRGNIDKNWEKHRVRDGEAEEVFFDENKKLFRDKLHSEEEPRYIIFGKTKKDRLLCVVFTVRKNKLRIISARDINKEERKLYEKET